MKLKLQQKMNTKFMKSRLKAHLIAATILLGSLFAFTFKAAAQAQPVKNIVLVHGAFADGSGFKAVYNILTKKGYNVTVVQNPLTSLKDDVDAANRILDKQDGPTVLVGHSYGGTVITEAGNNSKVVALVYIAAFMPDKGENTIKWVQSAPPAPENGILPPDDKGFVYYDKAKFHGGFAGDLSKAEADFMFASQGPTSVQCFVTPVAEAAWKTKPSYAIVATEDKSIVPDVERTMYKRAGAKVTEVKGSHVIFISQPEAVAKVIIDAANGVK
ncbi:alpha/beta hydrolase [Mucilaginibacter sp. P19]|uniref:Pimeloyl-ACP methyl ester carboxylesterase n=1 Tax=Mucilaginibacter gossypii TaxID=551996 RepID=A0A1G7W2T1_9SPHI|nr:alpha/beta hydrolase [Mucilaginibacter gossypii]SDG66276.1 Pimeloyl-ACP methyl ester carboxylesterase [Mucilaginibacter gossypii]